VSGLSDLHRHLDGSLRPSTVSDLAHERGLVVPQDLAFEAGMGLDAALERFAFTLSLLQDPEAVSRVASEICEDAEAEGVTTLEVRFAPQLHRGGDIEEVVQAALDGIAGRAGLLLCVLYGEPPTMAECLAAQPGIAGLDLAGGPAPGHRWSMEAYAPAFGIARDRGIGRTVHAGEGRPPAEIAVAIELLHANRIGHGTTLLQDAEVTNLVVERQVTIEACPTSNWHVGAIPQIEAHPLPRWLRLGVRACINTDNTLLSAVDAPEEHRRAGRIPGMTKGLLDLAIANGHEGAFRG
jgi:adenosine deaminase